MITSSQMPENVIYSGQFRPIVNPSVQQSGVYIQKQSFVPTNVVNPGGKYVLI